MPTRQVGGSAAIPDRGLPRSRHSPETGILLFAVSAPAISANAASSHGVGGMAGIGEEFGIRRDEATLRCRSHDISNDSKIVLYLHHSLYFKDTSASISLVLSETSI